MFKFIFYSAFIVLGIFPYGHAFCQSADEVIGKYVEAVGGMDKIISIKTVKISGHIPQGSTNIPYVAYVKVPNKSKTEITRQGLTLQRAFDGTTGWQLNPFRGVKIAEKMNAEDTKDMKKAAEFTSPLIDYKDKGYSAEYLGTDDFEGSDVYKIKLTDTEGESRIYYIDKVTNLILKESVKRKFKEKEMRTDRYYSVYMPVDGYMMPFSIETGSGPGETQKNVIDKVEFNVEIDDGIFEMPENK